MNFTVTTNKGTKQVSAQDWQLEKAYYTRSKEQWDDSACRRTHRLVLSITAK